LTNAVYGKASNRPDSFSITTTTITKDAAVVRAEVNQGGVKTPVAFNLVKKDPGFLDPHWSLQNPPMSILWVKTTAATVRVNGVDVALPGGKSDGQSASGLPAFPGTYTVGTAATSKYLSADPVQVTVGPGHSSFTQPAQVTPEPNDAFASAVGEHVDALLARCTAETVLGPAGCPFSALEYGDSSDGFGDVRNVVWKVTAAPGLYEADSLGNGTWRVTYGKMGMALATYDHDVSKGVGAPDWKQESRYAGINLGGTATVNNDEMSLSFDG